MTDPDLALPPMYAAVIALGYPMSEQPGGATGQEIGLAAWSSLTAEERVDALQHVLACYVTTVFEEERTKALQNHASDPAATFLDEFDEESLRHRMFLSPDRNGEVLVEQDALGNILRELGLLRYRLENRPAT